MNKSYLEMYANVEGVVEATRFEAFCLWKQWHEENGYHWYSENHGPLITVGHLEGRPVAIAPLLHTVNGKCIMFLEATSVVVDWDMIREWLKENVPSVCDGEYVKIWDAGNFHCLVH